MNTFNIRTVSSLISALVAVAFIFAAAPASAKTETQINNENRAKEYKAQKAQEKSAT